MSLDSDEASGNTADLKAEQASHYMQMEMVYSRKCLIKLPLVLWIHTSICLRPPGKVAFGQRGKKANRRGLWMKTIYASFQLKQNAQDYVSLLRVGTCVATGRWEIDSISSSQTSFHP